jgi:hypothetical protein
MNKIKRIAVIIAPIALALTACGMGSAAKETVTISAPAPYAPADDVSGFLAHIYANAPITKGVDSATLVDAARGICKTFSAGASVADVISLSVSSGLDSNTTAALISGAVLYLCPEYTDIVKAQL